jgi:hypothetical protein
MLPFQMPERPFQTIRTVMAHFYIGPSKLIANCQLPETQIWQIATCNVPIASGSFSTVGKLATFKIDYQLPITKIDYQLPITKIDYQLPITKIESSKVYLRRMKTATFNLGPSDPGAAAVCSVALPL